MPLGKAVVATYGRHRRRMITVEDNWAAVEGKKVSSRLFSSSSSGDSSLFNHSDSQPPRNKKQRQAKKKAKACIEEIKKIDKENVCSEEKVVTRKTVAAPLDAVDINRSIDKCGSLKESAEDKTFNRKAPEKKKIIRLFSSDSNGSSASDSVFTPESRDRFTNKKLGKMLPNKQPTKRRAAKQAKRTAAKRASEEFSQSKNNSIEKYHFSDFENYSLIISDSPSYQPKPVVPSISDLTSTDCSIAGSPLCANAKKNNSKQKERFSAVGTPDLAGHVGSKNFTSTPDLHNQGRNECDTVDTSTPARGRLRTLRSHTSRRSYADMPSPLDTRVGQLSQDELGSCVVQLERLHISQLTGSRHSDIADISKISHNSSMGPSTPADTPIDRRCVVRLEKLPSNLPSTIDVSNLPNANASMDSVKSLITRLSQLYDNSIDGNSSVFQTPNGSYDASRSLFSAVKPTWVTGTRGGCSAAPHMQPLPSQSATDEESESENESESKHGAEAVLALRSRLESVSALDLSDVRVTRALGKLLSSCDEVSVEEQSTASETGSFHTAEQSSESELSDIQEDMEDENESEEEVEKEDTEDDVSEYETQDEESEDEQSQVSSEPEESKSVIVLSDDDDDEDGEEVDDEGDDDEKADGEADVTRYQIASNCESSSTDVSQSREESMDISHMAWANGLKTPNTPHQLQPRLSLRDVLTPQRQRAGEKVLTPREQVLRQCEQESPCRFTTCIPTSMMKKCVKIGEGVYGEVFRSQRNGESVAIKIIPIEGDFPVNDEPQKKFEEILPEIVISKELSALSEHDVHTTTNFVQVKKVSLVQGKYPAHLLKEWDVYHKRKESENDRPDMFTSNQLFIIFEFEDSGSNLESFEFCSLQEGVSVLRQVSWALAVAEQALQFEHRDLHWGNVLVKRVPLQHKLCYTIDGQVTELQSHGVQVAIIDFTLSRLAKDGCMIFTDLSTDPTLFTGHGDYQFDVYRLMQEENGNSWREFHPYTNVLWLHYLADKVMRAKAYDQHKPQHKLLSRHLAKFLREGLEFNSCVDISQDCELFTAAQLNEN